MADSKPLKPLVEKGNTKNRILKEATQFISHPFVE